jgi:transposase-like protein
MEQEQTKRIRRTSAEIKNLLETFSQSGIAARDFCLLHSISEASFYKWRSRYATASAAKESNFVLLEETSGLQNAALLFAEVKGIKIYQGVTASYLKELIA